jgi:hypothetical protein
VILKCASSRIGRAYCVTLIVALQGSLSAQTLKFERIGMIEGPAERIQVHDPYAYLAAGQTLTVFDISNPVAPKRAGAFTFPEKIWGFRVSGSLVYVAADFFGLGILDLSNVSAPVLRGSIKTPGQAKSVAVSGRRAVVADHMAGIDLIDISDLSKPLLLESFYLEGYAKEIVAIGSHAYAVDSPTGFYAFDLSKAGPFEALSAQQSASAPGSIAVSEAPGPMGRQIAIVVGNGAPARNITDATTWSLQVYDVSKADAPTKVAAYRTPSGRPVRVAMKGNLVYVADGPGGLQVLDLSKPETPRLLGGHITPAPAHDVAVAGEFVFMIAGERAAGQVMILRQLP